MEYSSSCRLCLKEQNSMKSLLNVCIDAIWYSEVFTNLTGLTISSESIIPTWICSKCETDLLHFHKFQLKCIESDTILNSIFKIKEEENADYLCEYLVSPVEKCDSVKFEYLVNQVEKCESEELDSKEMEIEYLDYSQIEDIKIEIVEESETLETEAEEEEEEVDEKEEEEKPANTDKKSRRFFNNQNKSRTCEICDTILFGTITSYSDHIKNHDPKNKRPFNCFYCKKTFCNLRTREIHLHVHKNIKTLKCSYCPETFFHYSSRNLHQAKTHTKIKAYKCIDGCKNKAFYTQSQLILHTKRHHTTNRPFVCHICSKRYVIKGELDNHLKIHTDDKRHHQCEICGKNFVRKSSMLTHIKVHRNDEQYDCNYCDLKFSKVKLLSSHVKDHHRNYYACDVCDKTFNNIGNLRSHKYLHVPNEKFACPICPNKKYGANHLLRRHIRDSHPTIQQPPTMQEIRDREKLKQKKAASVSNDD